MFVRRLFAFLLAAFAAASAVPAAQSSRGGLFDEVWSTINESFYDPSFGGLDWSAVRAELRPKAASAASEDDERAVVNQMLARLKRSHFALLASSGSADEEMMLKGDATVPVEVRIVGREVVVTATRKSHVLLGDPALNSPLASGSRILSVDGKSVVPRAGEAPLVSWRRVNAALSGTASSPATIVHIPAIAPPFNTPRTSIEARVVPSGVPVQFSNLPPLRVQVVDHPMETPAGRRAGYIGFNIWMAQINEPIAEAVDKFRNAAGLIIDLRGNPGGLAAMISNVAGQILTRPDLLGSMRTRQIPQLKFVANPRTSTTDGRVVEPYSGPVAVIVDELTASASECFAGALQDLGRVRVFGRTSMGQALPASTKRLANGDVLEYVIGDFVTSKGRSLEGHGVVPDEIQPLSIERLRAGHDDPIEAALAWIEKQPKR